MSFTTFNFDTKIMARINALEYKTPTPIQKDAIPVVLEGKDVMGLAQTGTGKTAAFVLPMLQRLLPGIRGQIRALIIAPTRELAGQINNVIKDLGRKTGLRSLTVFGGVMTEPQVRAIQRGVDILVACPGRLLDLLGQDAVDLSTLEILVLDEADQMFDMGFLPDIKKIIEYVPAKRQTLMFSATMPLDIERLARAILTYPVHIESSDGPVVETVSHVIYPVAHYLKTPLLLEILKTVSQKSILIFTRTRYRTRDLTEKLIKQGFKAAALQGDLSQLQRREALAGFHKGDFRILVATDVAARGIDFTVSHVINYDMPGTPEAYVHRIGRTGRAEQTGEAYSLVTTDDNNMVNNLEYNMGQRFESRRIEGFDYDAPDTSVRQTPSLKDRKRNPFKKPLRKRERKEPGWKKSSKKRSSTSTKGGGYKKKGRKKGS